MVLLHVLHSLSARHQWRLAIAHFNHHLRGLESDADERFVQETGAKLSLRFLRGAADTATYARGEKLSVEMAARQLRHHFLARTARRLKIHTVALAHHLDDQVELFFLRLLRGSSGEGLAGMRWSGPSANNPRIQLIRPLLDQFEVWDNSQLEQLNMHRATLNGNVQSAKIGWTLWPQPFLGCFLDKVGFSAHNVHGPQDRSGQRRLIFLREQWQQLIA